MPTTSDNNKRIAKNTLMLYFRMLVMMAVSLYTSRVVLDTLGVSDYGIYNVVGGFVTMFSLISGAMTTATQRFLSFAIGEGKTDEGDKFVLNCCNHTYRIGFDHTSLGRNRRSVVRLDTDELSCR